MSDDFWEKRWKNKQKLQHVITNCAAANTFVEISITTGDDWKSVVQLVSSQQGQSTVGTNPRKLHRTIFNPEEKFMRFFFAAYWSFDSCATC